MSEQVDRLLRQAESQYNTPEESLAIATIAVATATAELVEQQRVANLLSLLKSRVNLLPTGGYVDDAKADIAAALGLGE